MLTRMVMVGLALALVACGGPQRTSGIDLANMDRSVRPQDDLYEYVNGAWLKKTEIPGDKSNYGIFTALADKARKDLVEAKNPAESLIHSTEKSMEEHSDKVDPTTIEAIELAIAALKDELETDNPEKIRSGIQNVTEAAMKLGEAIYKASQEEADNEPSAADAGPGEDDIVDAEFEDLDDDKRG